MHFALGRLNGFRYGYVTVITRFSHYDTLGVSQNATHERIKAKYYELSKKYHPDLNETEENAEKFRAVAEAYEVLGSVNERRTYDKLIQERGIGPGGANRQHHITVNEDYSQHLRERFHYSQRGSAVSRPRYRRKTQQDSSHRMIIHQRASEGNMGSLIFISMIFIVLGVYSSVRHS